MTVTDDTASAQTDAISFAFDLPHAPAKVWRALTKPEQKHNFGGARYGWKMMGGKLVELLGAMP